MLPLTGAGYGVINDETDSRPATGLYYEGRRSGRASG
jgi:hypothetical protein